MNTLDIIALVILSLSVLVCTIKGFMKMIAQFGSFCVAMIISKLVGSMLGERFLGKIIGEFAPIVGTVILFVVLLIACRIILGGVAKLITKVLKAKAVDKFLGALIGVVGGVAGIYLFALSMGLALSAIEALEIESILPAMVEETEILKYFM